MAESSTILSILHPTTCIWIRLHITHTRSTGSITTARHPRRLPRYYNRALEDLLRHFVLRQARRSPEESFIGRRIVERGFGCVFSKGAHVYLGAPLLHEGSVRVPRTGLVVQDDYGVRRQIKLPCQVIAQHHDISQIIPPGHTTMRSRLEVFSL